MTYTKIDWCDMSWNPVTGCKKECPYCYARQIVKRFGGYSSGTDGGEIITFCPLKKAELSEPLVIHSKNGRPRRAPYPFGFLPTLHRYRLVEPAKTKKSQTIFVCSMADLFGEWIPDEWISAVFEACEAAPWHRYMFLTKNPQRYNDLLGKRMLPTGDNYWYGGTRTGQDSDREHEASMSGNTFLSAEPILAPMEPETLNAIELWDLVIVGAETGNRRDKVVPKREWIEAIVEQCWAACVPVFMKGSLKPIWGDELITELPWR